MNILYENVVIVISENSEKLNFKKIFIPNKIGKNKPWFDEECPSGNQKLRAKLEICKRKCNPPDSRNKVSEARKSYKSILDSKWKRFEIKNIDSLPKASSLAEFWKLINRYKKTHSPTNTEIDNHTWNDFLSRQFTVRNVDFNLYTGLLTLNYKLLQIMTKWLPPYKNLYVQLSVYKLSIAQIICKFEKTLSMLGTF